MKTPPVPQERTRSEITESPRSWFQHSGFLEAEIPADFNVPRTVGRSIRRSKRTVLNTGIHACPSHMIESIDERGLEGKIRILGQRYHFGDRHIRADPLRVMQPHQCAKLAGRKLRADVLGISLSTARVNVLGIEETHPPASRNARTNADLFLQL